MEAKDIEKVEFLATISNTLDKFVYLRKDDKGFYIEYAFQEGAPHDNRCLSWYDSYQEKAYIRNGWVKGTTDKKDIEYLNIIRKKREEKVGELFRLSSFTCGWEEYAKDTLEEAKESWEKYHPEEPFNPEDHICKVGCPAKKCDMHTINWTYEEPVKCACWYLRKVEIPSKVLIPIEKAMKLKDLIWADEDKYLST